ncbi:MAG: hypothetical protein FJ087_02305, partial [Deltaproteobacteria bacterium]|nr:hypothetical protein [Deltaproteobacteria bacterium]
TGAYRTWPCEAAPCGGTVVGLSETAGGALTLLLRSGAGTIGRVEAAFASDQPGEPGYFAYRGEWWEGDALRGEVSGFRLPGTDTHHARLTLAAYGRIADDIAGDAGFLQYVSSPPYPHLSETYSHIGRDAADLLIEWATEVEALDNILVEFSRFRNLATIMDPRGLPTLGSLPFRGKGIDFLDRRTARTGDDREVYHDAGTRPPRDGLRFIDVVGSGADERVVLVGNGLGAGDASLPFAAAGIDAIRAGLGRVAKPFGVHSAWSPDGAEEIELSFHSGLNAPDFAAWADCDVVSAAGESGTVCPDDGEVDLWAVVGNYAFAAFGITDCSDAIEALPYRAAKGESLGTLAASGATPPQWRTSLWTGTGFFEPFCPYWALSPAARADLLTAARDASYVEQLTEPFLCNPDQGETSVFPLELTWVRRTTLNPAANPARIRFVRPEVEQPPDHRYDYVFLDAGGASAENGRVSAFQPWDPATAAGFRSLTLNPSGGTPRAVWYRVETTGPASAVLYLDASHADVPLADIYDAIPPPGFASNCDDQNPCTDDAELGWGGCSHEPNTAACFAGDLCTAGDVCDGGVCTAGEPRDCDDDDPCTLDGCDPAVGCVYAPAPGSPPCDDGNACTTGETCTAGACTGGAAVTCDDANACTTDSCDPAEGCVSAPRDGACDDGNACTYADTCVNGVCTPAGPTNCANFNACDDDSCDPAVGCVHTPNEATACSDNDLCTVGDHCSAGLCVPGGEALDCDDDNACTDDACLPYSGCLHPVIGCADTDPCTADSCDPVLGCRHEPVTDCDDANACTTGDTCATGVCAGTPVSCDDNEPCTADSCSPATGCANAGAPMDGTSCDDGAACTGDDTCTGGACIGTPLDCDDGNPCTNDSCVPGLGCMNLARTGACDDSNDCTSSDLCVGGACVGTPLLDGADCDDDDPCSDGDHCASGNCVATPIADGDPCSDANPCTAMDECEAGDCVGIEVEVCQCDPVPGCPDPENPECDDPWTCPAIGGLCDDHVDCESQGFALPGSCLEGAFRCEDHSCRLDCALPNPDDDYDGIDDSADDCPLDPLNDIDGDGVCGNEDNCPTTPNAPPEGLPQVDTDEDGIGDACEAENRFRVTDTHSVIVGDLEQYIYVSFEVGSFDLVRHDTPMGDMYEPRMPGLVADPVPGEPPIPFKRLLVEVPARWRSVAAESIDEGESVIIGDDEPPVLLWPSQQALSDEPAPPPSGFQYDEAFYTNVRTLPAAWLRVSQPFFLKNRNLVYLDIYPLRYRPADSEVELRTSGTARIRVAQAVSPGEVGMAPGNSAFDNALNKLILNPGMIDPMGDYLGLPEYLIISPQDLQQQVATEFVAQNPSLNGFHVTYWTVEQLRTWCPQELGRPSCMRGRLKDLFQQNRLEHVLIVADPYDIPPGKDPGTGLFGSDVPSHHVALEITGEIAAPDLELWPWLLVDCGDYCDVAVGDNLHDGDPGYTYTAHDSTGWRERIGDAYDPCDQTECSTPRWRANVNLFAADIDQDGVVGFRIRILNYGKDLALQTFRSNLVPSDNTLPIPFTPVLRPGDIQACGYDLGSLHCPTTRFHVSSRWLGRDFDEHAGDAPDAAWPSLVDQWFSDFDDERDVDLLAWEECDTAAILNVAPCPLYGISDFQDADGLTPLKFRYRSHDGDGYYTRLNGDDGAPDIGIGRIPIPPGWVASGEASNAFQKIIHQARWGDALPSSSRVLLLADGPQAKEAGRAERVKRFPFAEEWDPWATPTFGPPAWRGLPEAFVNYNAMRPDAGASEFVRDRLIEGVGTVLVWTDADLGGGGHLTQYEISALPAGSQSSFPLVAYRWGVGDWYHDWLDTVPETALTLFPDRGASMVVGNAAVLDNFAALGFVVEPPLPYESGGVRAGDLWTLALASASLHATEAQRYRRLLRLEVFGDPAMPVYLGHDADGDGVWNLDDNCVLTPNPDQSDSDQDGIGGVCEPNQAQYQSVYAVFESPQNLVGVTDAGDIPDGHDGILRWKVERPLEPGVNHRVELLTSRGYVCVRCAQMNGFDCQTEEASIGYSGIGLVARYFRITPPAGDWDCHLFVSSGSWALDLWGSLVATPDHYWFEGEDETSERWVARPGYSEWSFPGSPRYHVVHGGVADGPEQCVVEDPADPTGLVVNPVGVSGCTHGAADRMEPPTLNCAWALDAALIWGETYDASVSYAIRSRPWFEGLEVQGWPSSSPRLVQVRGDVWDDIEWPEQRGGKYGDEAWFGIGSLADPLNLQRMESFTFRAPLHARLYFCQEGHGEWWIDSIYIRPHPKN